MQYHRKQLFLDQADFQHLKHSLLCYYKEEKDLRGYLSVRRRLGSQRSPWCGCFG
nr:DUF2785 domain-containing protein [Brevibacillus sp. BC25]